MVSAGVGEGHHIQRRPIIAHQMQVPDRRHPPPRRLRGLSRGSFFSVFFILFLSYSASLKNHRTNLIIILTKQ